MVLGIDIDDVITETSKALVEHAKIHETDVCQPGDILDHLPEVMRGGYPAPSVKTYFERFMADIMAGAEVKDGAAAALHHLKAEGHRLVYITARGESRFPRSTEVTQEFIKEHNLPCDEIVFNSIDKLQDCLDHHIDLMVDDSVRNCEDLKKGGVNAVLFTSLVNKDAITDLDRVDDWSTLENYIGTMTKKRGA